MIRKIYRRNTMSLKIKKIIVMIITLILFTIMLMGCTTYNCPTYT